MRQSFNSNDIQLICDKDLIQRKNRLLKEFIEILADRADFLQNEYSGSFALSPPAKVNRGEHYKGFPYLVMDYPRIFSKSHMFAFRTLFWWGHFISCTIHLKGSFLADFSSRLPELIKAGLHSELELRASISGNEWNHDALGEEYHELSDFSIDEEGDFFKLTSILDLQEINNLHSFLDSSHKLLLKPFK